MSEQVVAVMRAADQSLTERDRSVVNEIRDIMSAMVWQAIESQAPRIQAALALSPAQVLAATMRGVMFGALAGAARCGRSIGMTPAEFQVAARDAFAAHEVVARDTLTHVQDSN